MTTITPSATAVNAYRNLGIRPGTAAGNTGAATPTGDSFAATLKDAAQSAIQNLKASEQQSVNGVAGQVDIRDVVLAVNNAEVTLQTAIAVRDKVIAAYQEIMRMPI
jgi:flagellar hook-basal body complex protein FliE